MDKKKDDPAKMAEMEAWLATVNAELGVDPAVLGDVQPELLDLIAEIAHGPSRPGAPLTAFIVGYAAASGKGEASELIARIMEIAKEA